MNPESDHDENLFESLAGLGDDLSPAAGRVHEQLWQRTRQVQRGRRWRRRGGQLVLVALVYAVGFFTAQWSADEDAGAPVRLVSTAPSSVSRVR